MTKRELASYLKVNKSAIALALKKASRQNESIAKKLLTPDTSYSFMDYTLEECLCILRNLDKAPNPIQIEMFKENFIDHNGKPVVTLKKESIYLKGMEKFLKQKENATFIRCCETCSFITGRMILHYGTRVFPFCTFYKKFLGFKNKTNIFTDWCGSYVYKKGEPRIWYNSKAPKSKSDTINGIKRSELEGDSESTEIIKRS